MGCAAQLVFPSCVFHQCPEGYAQLPQPCCPVVFSSCVPHQWPEVYGQSQFFPDCCFPALPKACPQLYPSLLSHLVSQLCCPACSHINFQLVSNDVFQIVYPTLFWGRRRYNPLSWLSPGPPGTASNHLQMSSAHHVGKTRNTKKQHKTAKKRP